MNEWSQPFYNPQVPTQDRFSDRISRGESQPRGLGRRCPSSLTGGGGSRSRPRAPSPPRCVVFWAVDPAAAQALSLPRGPWPRLTSHAGQCSLEGTAFHRPLDHLLLLTLGWTRDPAQAPRLQEPGLTLVAHQVLQKKAVLQRRFGGSRRLRCGAPSPGGGRCHDCGCPGNPAFFFPQQSPSGFPSGLARPATVPQRQIHHTERARGSRGSQVSSCTPGGRDIMFSQNLLWILSQACESFLTTLTKDFESPDSVLFAAAARGVLEFVVLRHLHPRHFPGSPARIRASPPPLELLPGGRAGRLQRAGTPAGGARASPLSFQPRNSQSVLWDADGVRCFAN